MSLISLPAFLARRREDTPMPETTREAPVQPSQAVLMQFRTRGDAVVDLYKHAWTERWPETENCLARTNNYTGFNWTCRGCDLIGKGHDLRDDGYSQFDLNQARRAANEHAGACWSMPKPDSQSGEG